MRGDARRRHVALLFEIGEDAVHSDGDELGRDALEQRGREALEVAEAVGDVVDHALHQLRYLHEPEHSGVGEVEPLREPGELREQALLPDARRLLGSLRGQGEAHDRDHRTALERRELGRELGDQGRAALVRPGLGAREQIADRLVIYVLEPDRVEERLRSALSILPHLGREPLSARVPLRARRVPALDRAARREDLVLFRDVRLADGAGELARVHARRAGEEEEGGDGDQKM